MVTDADAERTLRQGVWAGLAAYFIWGAITPVFFKQLAHVEALETIAHRVVWSLLMMGIVLRAGSGFRQVWDNTRDPRKLARVALGSLLATSNWLIFVHGINTGQILATSLGYFILPMLNVALGVLVLGERLRPAQWLAVGCAAAGVAIETARIGGLPWVSVGVALTFGIYGLLRKQLAMDSASGLFLETACLTPFALGYLLWRDSLGLGQFGADAGVSWLLIAGGPVTAVPLLLFAMSARRLPLTMIAFLQYLAPTLSFLVAVLVYREYFDAARAACFSAIWLGIAVYCFDLWRARPVPQ